ncbi:MAG: hypothetical protein J5746_10130 [Victivallales bacterium]|nr:hypothetical protein [Victivallales bacterium]
MRKLFILLALAAVMTFAADFPLLERFDEGAPLKGQLQEGASIAPDAGVEKGALCAIGDGSKNRIIYSVDLPVEGGKQYALAFNYRTEKLANYTFRVDVVYKGGGKPESFNMIASSWRWLHRTYEITAPEGAKGATLRLRLVGAPAGSRLLVDFLRMAPMVNGIAKGIHITDFETAFDGWRFDRHLIFDHFMPGPGGSVVNEWKEAKVGEAFFQAKGNGAPMQYALYIDNIKVTGNCNYIFEAWYKATKDFINNANGMLIFFYKDAKGNAIGQSRFHIRYTNGAWKEIVHSFTVPENCAWVDIGLNMRKMKEKEVIQLDHIRFKQGKSEVYLRGNINPDAKTLELVTALSGDLSKDKLASATLAIRKGDAEKPMVEMAVKSGEAKVIDISKYEDGPYTVQYDVVLKDGTKMSSTPLKIQICNSPSWTNDLGVQHPLNKAPAPWKDLQMQGNSVKTWNSTFAFSKGMQLQSIKQANGSELLVAPLDVTVGGKSIFTGNDAHWDRGFSLCEGWATISGEGFDGTVKASVDYSGFLHYTIGIKAKNDCTINDCTLKIKCPKLDFVHRSDDSWTDIGAVDLNAKKSWSTKHFFNEIHFGAVEQGLAWYAPKAYPAVSDYGKEWVAVSGEGNATFSFVNEPLQLKAGQRHSIEFAIMPYPFRPAANNWRTIRFRGGKYSNLDLIWQSSGHLKYAGSTMAIARVEDTKKILATRDGRRLMIYQFPFYIMDNIPEWSYFGSKWKGLPARAYDMRSAGGMAHKADISQKTWQDYYLKLMKDALEEYDWDGVYYDCYGTDTYKKNGEIYHPTFDCRSFQERIYNVQHLKNPASLTITHMGGAQAGTAAIFSDAILMGEQYRAQCKAHTYYMEFKTLDEFRYENAVNIGPDRMFLPQYHESEKIESPVVTTHVVGLAFLHNLMLYPNFIKKDVQLRIRGWLYDFGLEESTFHPYWSKEAALFTASNPEVKVSYYSNAKGHFLTVFNPTATAQKTKLAAAKGAWKGKLYIGQTGQEAAFDLAQEIELEPYLPVFIWLDK